MSSRSRLLIGALILAVAVVTAAAPAATAHLSYEIPVCDPESGRCTCVTVTVPHDRLHGHKDMCPFA